MFPKGSEWILILVVVLLLFGARKLPELARSLGASAKEFRKGIQDGSQDVQEDPSKPELKPPAPTHPGDPNPPTNP